MSITPNSSNVPSTTPLLFTQKQQSIHDNNTLSVPIKGQRNTTHSWPVIYNSQGARQSWIKSPQNDFDAAALYFSQQPDALTHYFDEHPLEQPLQGTSKNYHQFFLGTDGIDYYSGDPNVIDDNHNTINDDNSMSNRETQNNIYQTQLPPNVCTTSPNPVVILFLTLLMTTGATAMLCAGIMTSQWEFVRWDMKALKKIANESAHTKNIEWLLDGKVARIPIRGNIKFKNLLLITSM